MNTKTKKRSFVALMATLAVGTAAVAGFGIASIKSANNSFIAHADTAIEAEETYTDLVIGNNTLNLVAGETLNCIIGSGVEGVQAPSGWYTFTRSGFFGNASFEFTIEGVVETKEFTFLNNEFTVEIVSPSTTIIPVSSSANTTINFTISYSEIDPSLTSNSLSLGTQTVNADGMGIEYTFTSVDGGTYQLDCTDDNAFIMVDGEYGAEQILWVEGEDYEETWELEYQSYVFTLEAGGSITFLMSTNDWMDDSYSVTLVEI